MFYCFGATSLNLESMTWCSEQRHQELFSCETVNTVWTMTSQLPDILEDFYLNVGQLGNLEVICNHIEQKTSTFSLYLTTAVYFIYLFLCCSVEHNWIFLLRKLILYVSLYW